mgnify:CR=1 FL=1
MEGAAARAAGAGAAETATWLTLGGALTLGVALFLCNSAALPVCGNEHGPLFSSQKRWMLRKPFFLHVLRAWTWLPFHELR